MLWSHHVCHHGCETLRVTIEGQTSELGDRQVSKECGEENGLMLLIPTCGSPTVPLMLLMGVWAVRRRESETPCHLMLTIAEDRCPLHHACDHVHPKHTNFTNCTGALDYVLALLIC